MAFEICIDNVNRGDPSTGNREGFRIGDKRCFRLGIPGPYFPNHRFRLLDDDGVVYFEGLTDDDSSFLPLDTIGAEYGCTTLQFQDKKTKEWITL